MSTSVQSPLQELLATALLPGQVPPTAGAGEVSQAAAPAHLFLAVTSIPVGNNPVGVAIAPNSNLYVANSGSSNVSAINTTTDTVVGGPIGVGGTPVWLTVAPNGNAYVPNSGSNTVSVIDTATNAVVGAPIPVGFGPIAVAVAPNNKVYVSNINGNNVSVIQFPPTLATINPTQGLITGGTVVTLTGTNLTGASVNVGGNPATGVTVNATGTQLTFVTPPGAAGPATVTVTTPGGVAGLVNGFTYILPVHATTLTATPALSKLFPPHVYFPFLTATLTDQVTGLPVPGQTIVFSVGGNLMGTAVTDAQGVARFNETFILVYILGNGGYDASFAGATTPTAALSPSSAHAGVVEP
ncbi:IPT/TIG domain-containing protein [Streptomyces sioyaensis]|uniref:IPT/TIG domain-containing protein n=1 Tax=Streptomyces sioyaensis TaxID=67364 RepID=UPI0037BB3391